MKKAPAYTIMAILAIIAILAIGTCSSYKSKVADYTLVMDITEKKFTQFKTESGNNAAMADARIMDLQTLLALEKDKVDKLARELRLKPKAITRIVEVQLEGRDSIVLRRDTVLYPETYELPAPYAFSDRWNYFEAYVNDGQVEVNYSITDSLQVIETRNGNARTFTAFNSNPAIRITGLSAVVVDEPVVKKKKKWWYIPIAVAAGIGVGKLAL